MKFAAKCFSEKEGELATRILEWWNTRLQIGGFVANHDFTLSCWDNGYEYVIVKTRILSQNAEKGEADLIQVEHTVNFQYGVFYSDRLRADNGIRPMDLDTYDFDQFMARVTIADLINHEMQEAIRGREGYPLLGDPHPEKGTLRSRETYNRLRADRIPPEWGNWRAVQP